MRLDYQFNPDQIDRFSRYFLYFALFSFIFIISFTRIYNGDIWWSMAEGREIATNHSLQNENRFSYTFPSQPWNSAQWLFSLSAYGIHQLTGVPGLILIKIAVFLFIILLLIKILQPIIPNQIVLILLSLLFILSVHFRIMIRAHLFSILFFTMFLFLVDRYRSGKHRYLYWLPLITLFWSNFHSGLVFGFGLLALAAVEDFLAILFIKHRSFQQLFRKPLFRHYVLVTIACLITSFINPQGPYWLVHATTHLDIGGLIALVEYQPSWELLPTISPYFFLVIIYLTITVIRIIASRRFQPYDLVTLVFLYFSLRHNRIIPYFSAIAIVSCAYSLIHLKNTAYIGFLKIDDGKSSKIQIIRLLLGLFLILSPLFLFGRLPFIPAQSDFGLGINHFRLPVKATNFLKANPIAGNVYNSYYWGGYLIWELYPQKQVFIDGRVPAYPTKFIDMASQFRQYPQAFKAIDDIYLFQYLFFPNSYLAWNIEQYYDPTEWLLVYWDQTGALIYIRNNLQNAYYSAKFGYRYFTPFFSEEAYQRLKSNPAYLNQLIQEISRHFKWTGAKSDLLLLSIAEMEYKNIIENH